MKENPMEKELEELASIIQEAPSESGYTPEGLARYLIEEHGYRKSAEAPKEVFGMKVIECNNEWHSLSYEEYSKKHGAYPRSCPGCHNFFTVNKSPSPTSDDLQAPESVTVNGVKFYSDRERKGLVLDKIDDLINVQKHSADSHDYHHGMLNGLILAKSIIEDKTPKFYTRPDGRPAVPSVDSIFQSLFAIDEKLFKENRETCGEARLRNYAKSIHDLLGGKAL